MDVPLFQTHYDQARALWAQRAVWRDMPALPETALLGLERRLRLHLHVLSRVAADALPAGKDETDHFLWLAAGLLSPRAGRRREAAARAREWLTEGGAGQGPAAFSALALFPGQEVRSVLRQAWQEDAGLHAVLADIFRIQGEPLPEGGGADEGEDALAARLRHAAERAETPVEMLRPYYRAEADAVRTAALRGGLLHGDPEAGEALRKALTREAPGEALLRLAALAGLPEAGPLLHAHAAEAPDPGLDLLALWGYPEAVDAVLEGLDSARDNRQAAHAWQVLAGQRLAQRPRLQLVGAEDAAHGEDTRGGTFHEAEAAREWWARKRGDWPSGQRMLLGRPLTRAVALEALQADAGAGAHDGLDRLAMLQGSPAGVAAEDWILCRQGRLEHVPAAHPAAGD